MVHPTSPAFARLRRDLMRGRWRRLDPRLRFQVAAIAALLAAPAFWQLRLRYADLALGSGTGGAGLGLLATLAGIAVVGSVGTALRLRRRLRRLPPGPVWTTLPATARELIELQAWEAEMPLRALWALAIAALAAAATVADVGSLLTGVALFPLAWAGGRVAAVRAALAARGRPSAPALDDADAATRSLGCLAEAWAVKRPARARERRREGAWRRMPAVLALVSKDLLLLRHARQPRATLGLAVALGVASVAVWELPTPALRAMAFAVALAALAALGEWLIALGGRDPFPLLRSLPTGVGTIWSARMLLGAVATTALAIAHGLAARGPAPLLHASLGWLVVSGFAITALAVNLQLTLFPQSEPALRLFMLALALAVVCSVMIPLLGWIVLLAAVLQSSRKLARWWVLEDVA